MRAFDLSRPLPSGAFLRRILQTNFGRRRDRFVQVLSADLLAAAAFEDQQVEVERILEGGLERYDDVPAVWICFKFNYAWNHLRVKVSGK